LLTRRHREAVARHDRAIRAQTLPGERRAVTDPADLTEVAAVNRLRALAGSDVITWKPLPTCQIPLKTARCRRSDADNVNSPPMSGEVGKWHRQRTRKRPRQRIPEAR
jgi:hypothetical protein